MVQEETRMEKNASIILNHVTLYEESSPTTIKFMPANDWPTLEGWFTMNFEKNIISHTMNRPSQSLLRQKKDPGYLPAWRHGTSDLYPLRLKIRESKGWKVPESKRNRVPLSHLCPKSAGTFKTLYSSSNSWCIVKTRETHLRPGKFYPKLR